MNKLYALALASAVAGPLGCMIQQPNPDIDRVHKPYLKKSTFQDGKSWYLRRTLIDAPPESWFAIGDGDWPTVERLRWEIREKELIAYRDYEIVPGSETGEQPGADYKGAPVAVFPILEHFDIRRGYNPLTGEQTNVIQKNTDRPWYEREFFVVNWGADAAPPPPPPGSSSLYTQQFFPVQGTGFYVQEQESSHPDRARFSDDYLEFTRRESYQTNLYSCYGGINYGMAPDCAPGFVDRRWSFVKVNEEEDFEPTPFPDSVQLVDDHGDPVRDPRGHVVRIPIFEKFGFFRLERMTYDRDRGVTDSGRLLRAFKFNLWKKSFGPDGQAIPFAQREPKPIVYYMNAEVPEDEWTDTAEALNGLTIKQANTEIGDAYDRVFREIVATLQNKDISEVPRMFEVRENDCNFNHVKSFIEQHESDVEDSLEPLGGLSEIEVRHQEVGDVCRADPRGRACSDKRQKWNYLLKQACTALESASENWDDDKGPFTWQRLGDVRYSFMHLTDHLQSVGWLGLGMLAGDPMTGEIKNAFAYIDGPGTDYSATIASDYVDAMNDELLVSDLVMGEDVSNYVEQQNQQVGMKVRGLPNAQQIANVERRFRSLGTRPEEMLKEASGTAAEQARLQGLAGTPLENLLINEEDVLLAARRPLGPGESLTEDLLNKASPARGGLQKLAQVYKQRLQRASGGKDAPCRYLREFIDGAVLGMAMELKDLNPLHRWAYLRFNIYKTVMMHEVGHTLGLRHNFMGTWDALNFMDEFHEDFYRYTTDDDGPGPQERHSLTVMDAWQQANGELGQVEATLGADPPPSEDERQRLEALKTRLRTDVDTLVLCNNRMLEAEEHYVSTCISRDTSGEAAVDVEAQCRASAEWAKENGQLLRVDALDCLRVQEGKSSSIMDYHGKINGRFGGLGKWDAAALKFGYGQIVEEFAPEALRPQHQNSQPGQLAEWIRMHDYKKIADEFTTGPEAIRHRVNRYQPWSATQTRFAPSGLEVPYGFCSDEYAYTGWLSGTDTCRIRDWGANHREQMEHDLLRYKQYYFFTQFARNRLTWDIGAAISGNQDVFDKILLTFQYMVLYRAHNPTFFETELGKDFLQATSAGLDLYAEVLGQTEMGDFLESTGNYGFVRNSRERGRWLKMSTEDFLDLSPDQLNQADNTGSTIGLPIYYYGYCELNYCLPSQPYRGLMCTEENCTMPIALGDGRPSYLGFTNDYEDWFFTYVGNYFDKSNVLFNLVDSQAYFPKLGDEAGVSTDNPNVRLLRIGIPTVYGDSVRRLLHAITTNRVKDYANAWRPSTQRFIPRAFGALDAEAPRLEPNDIVLMPTRFTNIPYRALMLGMALQSSLDDTALDFTAIAQVGVKGEEDDIRGWDTLPAQEKAEWTHPISGVTYRAAKVGDYAIGHDLVQAAKRYADKYLAYNRCLDTDATNDGPECTCTYVGSFRVIDKNEDGYITGSGTTDPSNEDPDECVLLHPQDGLTPCEEVAERCAPSDLMDLRERALEDMEAAVEVIENTRAFYQYYAFGPRL